MRARFQASVCISPTGDFMQRIEAIAPNDLAAMTETMLCKTLVSTKGDETNTVMEMCRGVPGGSPYSPALFNVYIDTLAMRLEEAAAGEWSNPLNLFADDVVILAPTARKMQRLLRNCEEWASQNGLAWG